MWLLVIYIQCFGYVSIHKRPPYFHTLKYEVSRMGTPGGVDHKVLKSSPGMIVELYPLWF